MPSFDPGTQDIDWLAALRTGWTGRCPRCGEGAIFASWMTLHERCPVCGLNLADHDAGDGPAVFLIFILGTVITIAALVVEAWLRPPLWLHFTLWSALTLGATVALLRPARALTLGLTYVTRTGAIEDEEEGHER